MKYMKRAMPVAAIIVFLIAFMFVLDNYMVIKVDESTSIQFIRIKDGMKLTLGPGGINEIESIESFELYDNLMMQVLDHAEDQLITASDWIGPMIIHALDNTNGNVEEMFTGGWHGSNGDHTGNPTAKSIRMTLLVAENPIHKKGYFLAKQLTLEVTNQIMAYNTDERYVIEEKVTYTINPDKKIDISVELIAMENVRIDRYYGMQLILPDKFNIISYLRNGDLLHQFNHLENPYNASYTPVDEIIIEDIASEHRILASINLESDINNFAHKAEEHPYAFTTDDRKSYFNLVNGKPLYLKKGESYQWNGRYRFE
jgi:hypothetical protein